MTLTKRRLMILEDNPTVRYRQELARLRRQEAVPLETLLETLIRTADAEEENTAFIAQLTHAQCLAILRLYDNTAEQTAQLDRLEPGLMTLEEQARYNVEREARR